jgi:hypothetical protein
MREKCDNEKPVLREASPADQVTPPEDRDGDLFLEDSLAMTPWERMLANDDILNFGESLRSAMEKRNAKSQ